MGQSPRAGKRCLLLILTWFVYAHADEIQLSFGAELLSFPRFYSSPFHPNEYTNENYFTNAIEVSSSDAPSLLLQRFATGQYGDGHEGRRIGEESFEIHPRLYTLFLAMTWQVKPYLRVGFETGLWGGNQQGDRFNKYFILDASTAKHYRYMVEVEEANRFRAWGLFAGPKISFYIQALEFLHMLPYLEATIRTGTYLVLKEETRLRTKHFNISGGGRAELTNALGRNKNAEEIEEDNLDRLSDSEYRIVRDFTYPLSVNSKWTLGLDFALSEKWQARLYGGLEWHVFWLDTLKTDLKRDSDFYVPNTDPGTLEKQGTTQRSKTLLEKGFFLSRVSPIFGIEFVLSF